MEKLDPPRHPTRRSQVRELKDAVSMVDPDAFMVIGMGQTAYGEGFHRAIPDQLSV